MPKSRVRKKKGKPVKYTPKPTGVSKTKMKKLMELLEQYQKDQENGESQIPEIRDGQGTLIIPEEFKKKMNIISEEETPDSGPELSINEKNNDDSDSQKSEEEKPEENNDEGPQSSDGEY